jgi:hypothetical protein
MRTDPAPSGDGTVLCEERNFSLSALYCWLYNQKECIPSQDRLASLTMMKAKSGSSTRANCTTQFSLLRIPNLMKTHEEMLSKANVQLYITFDATCIASASVNRIAAV